MQRLLLTIFCATILLASQGCAQLGMDSPFSRDPVTGGEDTAQSQLLQVLLPAGMQRYSSHGRQVQGAAGTEGLEVLRGSVGMNTAIQTMYGNLNAQGWQLRMSSQVSDRAITVYERGGRIAVLAFRKQGTLTILEIWLAQRLAKGVVPVFSGAGSPGASQGMVSGLPGEEYAPIGSNDENSRTVYRGSSGNTGWGGKSSIQERDL